MEGDTAPRDWAQIHFGNAPLPDARLARRLPAIARAIRERPADSLPFQLPDHNELTSAYRFLSNHRIDPQDIQMTHRQHVAAQCSKLPVILLLQDTTELDFSKRAARGSITGVGPLGAHDGGGQGLLQHAALAATPEGKLLGVIDQQWYVPRHPPVGETRLQRRQRETRADVWANAARSIAKLDFGACRVIHVGDRHSDNFTFFNVLHDIGHGFVVRAMHDRYVAMESKEELDRLFQSVASLPVVDVAPLHVPARSGARTEKRAARDIEVELRFGQVTLQPPVRDERFADHAGITVTAIELAEIDPAANVEAIHWVLLTSEPVASSADAWRIAGWYRRRWVIEEWHKVLKEGCRIERAQLDEGDDIKRLAAIMGPIAADLLSLRDLADDPATANDPEAVAAHASEMVIEVVAVINNISPSEVTPKLFWRTLARKGGYLGRKRDPRPGWKVIWRGYHYLESVAVGYDLAKGRRGDV